MTAESTAPATRVSDWLTIDQARIDAFADLTGDHNPLHVDPQWAAAEGPFAGTVAHGFLTLSLLTQLGDGLLPVPEGAVAVNYGFERVRFARPVPVGSRVRGRFALVRSEARGRGTLATVKAEIEVEGAMRPALVAEWLIFITASE
jgi:acyl dehydratase